MKNTRKVLDDFENTYNKIYTQWNWTKEEVDELDYFSMHLAKALMQDGYIKADAVAKIILASMDLSSEIKVKVE